MNTPSFSHLLKLHSFLTGHCNWCSQEAGSAPCASLTGVQRVMEPLAAVDLRMPPLTSGLCSSPLRPHTALLHWDSASGTTGHLGASWALNEARLFFFFFNLPFQSAPFPNTNNTFISHLAWLPNRYAGELGAWGNSFLRSVSHDHSHKRLHACKLMPFNLPSWQYSY